MIEQPPQGADFIKKVTCASKLAESRQLKFMTAHYDTPRNVSINDDGFMPWIRVSGRAPVIAEWNAKADGVITWHQAQDYVELSRIESEAIRLRDEHLQALPDDLRRAQLLAEQKIRPEQKRYFAVKDNK